ncbi:hypothetical protein [Terriglobus tenax]|uniref:hypothetical protein n=1 Tax=Terriglobus tenax TaxID=1111115 RepID=UPI0021E089F1|nr:hypothetical protein [Terriglobus tenax]
MGFVIDLRTRLLAVIVLFLMAASLFAQDSIDECSPYEKVALPAEATSSQKDGAVCDSYDLYRGLGQAVNYRRAGACAWKQRQQRLSDPDHIDGYVVAGGSLTLADLYANGLGVEKNLPLAKRFVCEVEGVVRAEAIEAIDKPKPDKRRFELCDYAVTTIAINECFSLKQKIEDQRQWRFFQSLKTEMTPPQQAAFDHLLAAEKNFIDLHRLEVYQGGTIRGVRTMGSQAILKDLFRVEVIRFLRNQWPATKVSAERAESQMSAEYHRQITAPGKQTNQEMFEGENVSAGNLAKVQKSWQAYRDAWVAFAQTCDPGKAAAVQAEVTLDRYRYLKTITATD